MTTEIATIGHNMPPPVETHGFNINDLYDEARNYLDGQPITTDGQASDVAKLLEAIRLARKAADEQRALEKKPHDEAAKAVQSAWKPLLEKCDLAASVAKKALTPYLAAKQAEQEAEAAAARKVAQDAQDAALAAQRAAQASDDLAAAETAAQATKAASIANAQANRAEKARPQAAGGARAIGLRTSWKAVITDRRALLSHYMATRPNDLTAWLQDQAEKDVRAGSRAIPGVVVEEERHVA